MRRISLRLLFAGKELVKIQKQKVPGGGVTDKVYVRGERLTIDKGIQNSTMHACKFPFIEAFSGAGWNCQSRVDPVFVPPELPGEVLRRPKGRGKALSPRGEGRAT